MSQKKKKSMSDKLLDLINPTPVYFDPEADIHTETAAKVVDNDYDDEESSYEEEEEALSQFRKQNVQLIEETDERYTGKKVTRKSLANSDDELSEDGDSEADGSSGKPGGEGDDGYSDSEGSECDSGDGEDLSGVEVDDNDDDDEEEEEDYSISQSQSASEDTSFKHMSSQGDVSQGDKGNAIHRQLGLWDNLLECRIQLQKCLASANKLPQPETLPEFRSQGGSKFASAADQTKKSVANLLEKLVELRAERLKHFGETKNIGQARRPDAKAKKHEAKKQDASDEEITSSSDDQSEKEEEEEEEEVKRKPKKRKLSDYPELLATQHKEFVEYRNATIQKWNDKTRVAFGNVNSRNFAAFEQSTLRQIEQIMSNRQRLIGRTREKRSAYKVLGKESATTDAVAPAETMEDKSKEFDVEIFDDSDFYHQLLRELIERKASDVTDPVQLGRQWLELQKARSKMKRKVDMRATKGRKIRYTVHPKLVNFMAPVNDNKPWNEDAKGELYNSLFGKSK